MEITSNTCIIELTDISYLEMSILLDFLRERCTVDNIEKVSESKNSLLKCTLEIEANNIGGESVALLVAAIYKFEKLFDQLPELSEKVTVIKKELFGKL